jgi:hypothetical protein
MKNILTITHSIIGLCLMTACLFPGSLIAQENGSEVLPIKKEKSKQGERTKVPAEKPAFTPFAENNADRSIDKEEALKQWDAQQKEAADTANAFRNGGRPGQQIIIRKSFTTVDKNGEKQTESSGKMVIVGPDGERKEIELDGTEDIGPLNFNIPGFAFGRPAIRLNQPNLENSKEGFGIGSVCQPVGDAMRLQLALGDRGLLVLSVSDDSPAAKAGIKKHDILVFADDKELETKKDLEAVVEIAGEENQSFSLGLIREGKELTVEVSPIEKSKLRAKQGIRFGGNMNFAQPLNLKMNFQNDIDLGNMEKDMHRQMLESIQRLEQAAEQFNLQLPELREKK